MNRIIVANSARISVDQRRRQSNIGRKSFSWVGHMLLTLEPWRILICDAECPFEGQPNLSNQTIVEKPAHESDAMRHPTRWIEFWERISRIRSPVTARFRDLNKTRTQRQRWVPGKVCN